MSTAPTPNRGEVWLVDFDPAVGAEMPATRAAFEVNAAQSAQGQEQDFSAVILEMERQAHLGSGDDAVLAPIARGHRP